jgi:hypothetical protein
VFARLFSRNDAKPDGAYPFMVYSCVFGVQNAFYQLPCLIRVATLVYKVPVKIWNRAYLDVLKAFTYASFEFLRIGDLVFFKMMVTPLRYGIRVLRGDIYRAHQSSPWETLILQSHRPRAPDGEIKRNGNPLECSLTESAPGNVEWVTYFNSGNWSDRDRSSSRGRRPLY